MLADTFMPLANSGFEDRLRGRYETCVGTSTDPFLVYFLCVVLVGFLLVLSSLISCWIFNSQFIAKSLSGRNPGHQITRLVFDTTHDARQYV